MDQLWAPWRLAYVATPIGGPGTSWTPLTPTAGQADSAARTLLRRFAAAWAA